MIRVLKTSARDLLGCVAIAVTAVGPAAADVFCDDIKAMVSLAADDVDPEGHANSMTVLSGASECDLAKNPDGARNLHCFWEYPYRAAEAYDQFDSMVRSLGVCFDGATEPLRDQPVNHPDFYDQLSIRIGDVTVAVSIKDKSASGKTFTFENTKTTNYRVYCRQALQEEFGKLGEADQQRVTQLFASCGGLDSLHADGLIDSGMSDMFVLPRNPSPDEEYETGLLGPVLMQPRN